MDASLTLHQTNDSPPTVDSPRIDSSTWVMRATVQELVGLYCTVGVGERARLPVSFLIN
jgi:hypothetical protein